MSEYSVKYRIGVDTGDSPQKLSQVAKGAQEVDQKMQKVAATTGQGSGSATYALTNFNRVVQDAPYGLMGVANNIDPLMSSFQKLKAETGSTSGAFKAMLGTLSGPMGMLFGINLAILALQVLPGVFSKVSSALSGTTEKMKQLTDATKTSAIMSNEKITKSFGEALAIKQLGEEIRKTNAKSAERKVLIDQIKSINPELVKGIDLHTASEKELGKWVDKTIDSVREKVKAQLVEIFLAPTYAKISESYTKYSLSMEEWQNAVSARNKYSVSQQVLGRDPSSDAPFVTYTSMIENLGKRVDDELKKLNATLLSTDFIGPLQQAESIVTMLMGKPKSSKTPSVGPNKTSNSSLDTGTTPESDDYFIRIRPISDEFRSSMAAEAIEKLFPGMLKASMSGELPTIKETKLEILDLLKTTSKSFDEFTGYSKKLESGLMDTFNTLSIGLTETIMGFSRLDLALKSFLTTLLQVIIQSTILSLIQGGLGLIFGGGGISGWISENIFGVEGKNRSITSGGISPGTMATLRNLSRQTVNFGGAITLKASGRDLKTTITAEELFRATQR